MQLGLDFQSAAQAAPEPKIHSVSEITRRVRQLIEDGVGEAWVEGEISNLRVQSSGHRYFTLKDSSSQLACVLFSKTAATLRDLNLQDGQQVQVFGELTVYEPRGQYQMIVRLAQTRGAGALQAKFEALKLKLAAEGLFDPARKRALPALPRAVGVVTSPTGAALRDFLKVLKRRQPGIRVLLNPVRVQGQGAAEEIARAIREFGRPEELGLPPVDVIVVTRGGGSLEDLWEFNEEIVARAIAESPVPVLCGIGHEIDFTIADFAADLRAPTPSAAAELLAPDRAEVLARMKRDAIRLERCMAGRLELLRARVAAARQSPLFREPLRRLEEARQTADRFAESLQRTALLGVERRRAVLADHGGRLAGLSPAARLLEFRHRLALSARRLDERAAEGLQILRLRLEKAAATLAALSPQATLARGFTLTSDAEGRPITSAAAVRPGMTLRTRFRDGETESIAKR